MSKSYKTAKVCIAWLVLFAVLLPVFAQEKRAPFTSKILPNGLEVLVVENNAVPLVTVSVVFRGGAIAQTAENAGLFHLYEHMMFAGNEKYPSGDLFISAMNQLGVSTWSGSTGHEYINYYITLPSSKIDEGIEFWSWAIRKPIFNREKLMNEKEVVVNEIKGYQNDPKIIALNAITSRMFRDQPWRTNVDGPAEVIRNATVQQLEEMKQTYYIPKNAALIIAGDIQPDKAFALAEKWYGDWEGPEAPDIDPLGSIAAGVNLIYPTKDYYPNLARLQFSWRGPDVATHESDTYIANVLCFLLTSKSGKFKTNLMRKFPELYEPDLIEAIYNGTLFDVSALLSIKDPATSENLLIKNEKFRNIVLDEFSLIAKNPEAYFGFQSLDNAKTKLIDLNIMSEEIAGDFSTEVLTWWWSVASTNYFLHYEDNIKKVTFSDIAGFINRYIARATNASIVQVQSDTYTSFPDVADKETVFGYQQVNEDNAYWWQQ